jgi:hypothetical protein
MGSSSSVSTLRWLGLWCAMAAVAFGEPWWSAMTLAVLCSTRRMGGHLGVDQFGGKVARGWSSRGRRKTTVKLQPIPMTAVALRCSEWSGGDRGGEGALARS